MDEPQLLYKVIFTLLYIRSTLNTNEFHVWIQTPFPGKS